MRDMFRKLCGIPKTAVLFLVFSAAASQVFAEQKGPGGLKIGDAAPNFRTKAAGGETFDLYELAAKKKLVLLAFWGLRCGDCIEEIPSLNDAQKEWGGEGLQVVGINVDGIDVDFLRKQLPSLKHRPDYAIVVDPDLKIADALKLEAAPLTIGISPERKVVFVHSGFQEGDAAVLKAFLSRYFSSSVPAK
jgi:peroxiredoxin